MQAKTTRLARFNWKPFLESPNLLPNTLKLFLFAAIPSFAYFQDFIQVLYLALSDSEIQYVLLVPFVAAFFFYKKRKAFLISRKNLPFHDVIGISLCLLALLIYVWGSYSFYPLQLHLISLPIFVAGIMLLIFGVDILRILIFPIFLLFFLSPFPLVFSDVFGVVLIDSVATISANILRLFFFIEMSYRPIVTLSTYASSGQRISFELAPACSGIYSLTAMAFFTVIFLYIASGSLAKKTVFASLSLFTAYTLNVLRIILTVTLGYYLGYGLAVDFFHLSGGLAIVFLGTLILLFASDKLLKLSFQGKNYLNCLHNYEYDGICYRCGRILKLPKIRLEWKRTIVILLFLAIVASLIFQTSNISYNRVANQENLAIDFDPNTGQLEAFSDLSDWSLLLTGREYEAEKRLGVHFIGDYVLYNENSSKQFSVILEFSDAQSKFHIWEGCLKYQSFEINIEKRFFSTIYDENNIIVIAETLISDVPAYKQKLIVLYWFDSLNIRTNGTTNIWATKISLLTYVYDSNDQTNTNQVETASNELLTLARAIEESWSPFKVSPSSFVVDLYRNKELSTAFVVGMLIVSTAFLQTQSFLMKARCFKKVLELPKEYRYFLKSVSPEKQTR